jgi:hypothetical protein
VWAPLEEAHVVRVVARVVDSDRVEEHKPFVALKWAGSGGVAKKGGRGGSRDRCVRGRARARVCVCVCVLS